MKTEHSKIIRKLEGSKDRKGFIQILTEAQTGVSDYFIPSTYRDASGKENKCYEVTKLGCYFLANKSTGEKGVFIMDRCTENVIEFLENQQQATVTFSQRRYKTRIRKLAETRPEECQIVAENKDGSICAHIPTAWVRIAPPPVRTEAQREASRRNALNLPRAGREKG